MSGNKNNTTKRVHTLTWEDPDISARDVDAISGIDYLRAIKNGQIESPPVAKLVGYRIVDAASGRAVFALRDKHVIGVPVPEELEDSLGLAGVPLDLNSSAYRHVRCLQIRNYWG